MTKIIGIDFSTDPKKTGISTGLFQERKVTIDSVITGKQTGDIVKYVADFISRGDDPALIAIDAPLGWPEGMGKALTGHQAGKVLPGIRNTFFQA